MNKPQSNSDRVTSALSKVIVEVVQAIEVRDNISLLRWEDSTVGWSKVSKRWLVDLLPTEKEPTQITSNHRIQKIQESGKIRFHAPKRSLSILSKANTNYHIRYTTLYPLILKKLDEFRNKNLDEIISHYGGEEKFKLACRQRGLGAPTQNEDKTIKDLIYGLEYQKADAKDFNRQLEPNLEKRFLEILNDHKYDLFDYKGCYFQRIEKAIRQMEAIGSERELVVATYLGENFEKNPKIDGALIKLSCSGDQRDMIKGIDIKIIYDAWENINLTTNTMTIQVKPAKLSGPLDLKPIPSDPNKILVPSVGMVKGYDLKNISHLAFIYKRPRKDYMFLVKNDNVRIDKKENGYVVPLQNFSSKIKNQFKNP